MKYQNLEELATLIDMANSGFSIATYEKNPEIAENQLKSLLPHILFFDMNLQSINLDETTPSLEIDKAYNEMKKRLERNKNYSKGIISVFGLEDTYKNSADQELIQKGRRPRSLSNINLVRDRYWTGYECHTLFWIKENEVGFIARNAPDFWSRISGLYNLKEV